MSVFTGKQPPGSKGEESGRIREQDQMTIECLLYVHLVLGIGSRHFLHVHSRETNISDLKNWNYVF